MAGEAVGRRQAETHGRASEGRWCRPSRKEHVDTCECVAKLG